jgi:enoyl-CoA hydratase/carnithine racemase
MEEYETLKVTIDDGVATVLLNRPARLNAWTPLMGQELLQAFQSLDRNSGVRAVILAGAGRAFCAGADVDFFRAQIEQGGGMGSSGGLTRSEAFPLLMRQFGKPTIAALHGYVLGVGATMSLLCDLRIASRDTKIGFVFARMGVMSELGSTFLLPRIVGLGRACELLLSGKTYTAAQCRRFGLLNEVVREEELLPRARALAAAMAECAPLSLRLTRQALYQGLENSFEGQLRIESLALEALYHSEDHAEAVRAFKEKRPPVFRGR